MNYYFQKTGNLNLDNLSDNFNELKRTYQRLLEIKQENFQTIIMATSITKTALLIVVKAIESIANTCTKGPRVYPSFNSVIAFVRARRDLAIQSRLLCDWYKGAVVLDLLLNDPDYLVKSRKAYWAMELCTESLMWARGVFNESFRTKKHSLRPIYDRDDSISITNE